MDSQVMSDRARAQKFAKIAAAGLVLNPLYISVVQGEKPVAYQDDTGLAYGAYPVDGLGIQPVEWDSDNLEWDDIGSPLMRQVDLFDANNPTYNIGSGGDYETITAALEDLSFKSARYFPEGRFVKLNILTGHAIQEQIMAKNIDLSRFIIESADAEVNVDRESITDSFRPTFGAFSNIPAVFTADNAALPIINTKFQMGSEGTDSTKNGFNIFNGSRVIILPDAGFSQCHHNLFGFGSNMIVCNQGKFQNAVSTGVRVENGALLAAQEIDATGSDIGSFVRNGCFADLRMADLTGCTTNGLLCRGSYTNFRGGDAQKGASPDATDMVVERGGTIAAHDANGGGNTVPNAPSPNGIIYRDWPDHRGGGIYGATDQDGNVWSRYPDGTMEVDMAYQQIPATEQIGSTDIYRSSAGERLTFTFPKEFDQNSSAHPPKAYASVKGDTDAWANITGPADHQEVVAGVFSIGGSLAAPGEDVTVHVRGRWDRDEMIGKNPP